MNKEEKLSMYSVLFYVAGMATFVTQHLFDLSSTLTIFLPPCMFLFFVLGSYCSSYALPPQEEISDINKTTFWMLTFVFAYFAFTSINLYFNFIRI
jgi:hypothetical protein